MVKVLTGAGAGGSATKCRCHLWPDPAGAERCRGSVVDQHCHTGAGSTAVPWHDRRDAVFVEACHELPYRVAGSATGTLCCRCEAGSIGNRQEDLGTRDVATGFTECPADALKKPSFVGRQRPKRCQLASRHGYLHPMACNGQPPSFTTASTWLCPNQGPLGLRDCSPRRRWWKPPDSPIPVAHTTRWNHNGRPHVRAPRDNPLSQSASADFVLRARDFSRRARTLGTRYPVAAAAPHDSTHRSPTVSFRRGETHGVRRF